jgi:hypothetical protein
VKGAGFPGANADGAGNVVLHLEDFVLRQLHQPHHLLRPPAQHHSLLGQGDSPVAPLEQGDAQLLLQLLHLPGEGGLGHMKDLGGGGNRALPDNGQIVLHGSDFHGAPSFLCYAILA